MLSATVRVPRRNPHPSLSHDEMWEREERPSPSTSCGRGEKEGLLHAQTNRLSIFHLIVQTKRTVAVGCERPRLGGQAAEEKAFPQPAPSLLSLRREANGG